MQDASLLVDARGPDAESQKWLDALAGTGRRQEDAIGRLRELLVRAARFEITRRRRDLASGPTSC